MLPDDLKQCDLCKRDFPKYEPFTLLTITWDHNSGSSGRYVKKQLCKQCYNIASGEIDKALHSAARITKEL